MSQPLIPTKGELLKLTSSEKLAEKGYELMDRKKNILMREMMELIHDVRALRSSVSKKFEEAYRALQDANITLGIVGDIAKSIPIDDGITIKYRSVMGVELPKVSHDTDHVKITYGLGATNTKFDYAYKTFLQVRDMLVKLAEIDNAAYRLANAIRKTKKRANALEQIVLPKFKADIKYIRDVLEEKDREAFSRQKMIKKYMT